MPHPTVLRRLWHRASRAWAWWRAAVARRARPASVLMANGDDAPPAGVDPEVWRFHLARGAPLAWLRKVAAGAPDLLRRRVADAGAGRGRMHRSARGEAAFAPDRQTLRAAPLSNREHASVSQPRIQHTASAGLPARPNAAASTREDGPSVAPASSRAAARRQDLPPARPASPVPADSKAMRTVVNRASTPTWPTARRPDPAVRARLAQERMHAQGPAKAARPTEPGPASPLQARAIAGEASTFEALVPGPLEGEPVNPPSPFSLQSQRGEPNAVTGAITQHADDAWRASAGARPPMDEASATSPFELADLAWPALPWALPGLDADPAAGESLDRQRIERLEREQRSLRWSA